MRPSIPMSCLLLLACALVACGTKQEQVIEETVKPSAPTASATVSESKPAKASEGLHITLEEHISLPLPRKVIAWKADDSPGYAKPADATGLIPTVEIGPWKEGDSLGRLLQVLEVDELQPLHLLGQKPVATQEEAYLEEWTSLLALPVYKSEPIEPTGAILVLYEGPKNTPLYSPRLRLELRQASEGSDQVELAWVEDRSGDYLAATLNEEGTASWGSGPTPPPEWKLRGIVPPSIQNSWRIEGYGKWLQDHGFKPSD